LGANRFKIAQDEFSLFLCEMLIFFYLATSVVCGIFSNTDTDNLVFAFFYPDLELEDVC
jgi:hypothetical protein